MKYLFCFLISGLVFLSSSDEKKEFINVMNSFCIEFEQRHPNELEELIIDGFVHIGNFSDCMHPDESFIVETANKKYKVSAVKNIFFHDISDWILIRDCEIDSVYARVFYQVIINDTIKLGGNCHFVFENSKWGLTKNYFNSENRKFLWSDLIDAYNQN